MDYELSATQREIYQYGAALEKRFGHGYWAELTERGEFPRELWAELGAAGHLGTLVPTELGGRGLGITEMALLTEGLAARGYPLLMLVTGPALSLPAIAQHGSDKQRTEVLPALLAGEQLVPFAITEAASGSNILNLRTRAELDGDRVIVSGTKNYTSAADVASHVMVVARTTAPDAKPGRPDGFTVLLVPTDAPGFTRELADTQVHTPERQCTLTFDNVVLGTDDVVGKIGKGLHVLRHAMVYERIVAAALSCGVGQYAIDCAVSYVAERAVFGAPLATHQAVQHPLARCATQLQAARLLVRHASWLADKGQHADGAANMASYAAGQAGFDAADAALQAHGGFGYTRSAGIFGAYQVARLFRSAPVNAESALNAIGELVLGLPRSY